MILTAYILSLFSRPCQDCQTFGILPVLKIEIAWLKLTLSKRWPTSKDHLVVEIINSSSEAFNQRMEKCFQAWAAKLTIYWHMRAYSKLMCAHWRVICAITSYHYISVFKPLSLPCSRYESLLQETTFDCIKQLI